MGKKKVAHQAALLFKEVERRQYEAHYEKPKTVSKDQDVSHLGLNAGNFADYIKNTRGNRLKG